MRTQTWLGCCVVGRCLCALRWVAESGQQLMAFPCIQMRNFDGGREGGHVWKRRQRKGGGDLDYLLPHASILQERGGASWERCYLCRIKGWDGGVECRYYANKSKLWKRSHWSCKTRGQWKQSQSNVRTTISQCSSDSVTMMGKGRTNHHNQ